MTTKQQSEMHHEHVNAGSEIDSWQDDINMWRAEHKQALAWLSQIGATILEHDARLQQHFSTIERQERHIRQHEHAIVMKEQLDRFKDQSELDGEHQKFNLNQTIAREDHARIGDSHRKRVASVKRLLKQFSEEESC